MFDLQKNLKILSKYLTFLEQRLDIVSTYIGVGVILMENCIEGLQRLDIYSRCPMIAGEFRS